MTIFRDCLAIVTGSSSGIGEEAAKILAREGAKTVLMARRANQLKRVAKEIKDEGGVAIVKAVDLTESDTTATAVKAVISKYGPPDIVINNAGFGLWRFLEETTAKEACAMMGAPYNAAVNVTHAALPAMIEAKRGHIAFVNSPACCLTFPGSAAYSAARWALRGLARSLDTDLRGTGLTVTHAILGNTDSGYWSTNTDSRDRIPKIARLIPSMSSAQAAQALLNGIRRNKRHVSAPFLVRAVLWQQILFPRFVDFLNRTTGVRHPSLGNH